MTKTSAINVNVPTDVKEEAYTSYNILVRCIALSEATKSWKRITKKTERRCFCGQIDARTTPQEHEPYQK